MKIIFRTDSRDKVYQQKFGQTILLPDEINVDSTLIDDVQPIGDVKCTCYSTCDIAEDQQKREFDIDDLWARIDKNQFGADPREPLGQAVSQGLLPKGQGQRVKDWKSYWSALNGVRDNFDNVRSALVMANSPVMVATYWYSEWLNIPALGVMPIGQNTLNGHAYVVEGWKQINGEPMLIVEAWVGRKMYMPRSTFNDCTKHYGMQAWVLSTSEIDARRQKTILETIKDACINVIILMKQLLLVKKTEAGEEIIPPVTPPERPKPPVVESKLEALCLAIRDYEGKPGDLNYRNNNPGNIRGVDGKFLKFKTMEEGFDYLKKYVKRAATGEHKAYKKGCTIEEFFKVYAPTGDNNNPDAYAKWVAKRIGETVDKRVVDII